LKMAEYYQNALCIIAATGSSDSNQGMFPLRPAVRFTVRPCEVFNTTRPGASIQASYLEPELPHFGHCIEDSPLYKRGWVLQERTLATRTIHLTDHAVFLEEGPKIISEFSQKPETYGLGPGLFSGGRDSILGFNWYRFISSYTKAKLSYETDRLPAISGIAKQVFEQESDEYCAGLWRERLWEGLAWCTTDIVSKRPSAYIAPSWSWASVNAEVRFFAWYISVSVRVATVIDVQIIPEGLDHYGLLCSGTLQIEGPVSHLHYKSGEFYINQERLTTATNNETWDAGTVKFDDANGRGKGPDRLKSLINTIGMPCLLLYSQRHSHHDKGCVGFYLILEPVSCTKFKRVGCVEKRLRASELDAERQNFVIV
jgi:hypothetical protein